MMGKFMSVILIIAFLFTIVSCGDSKVINNKQYETYGLFNKMEVRKENIEYRLIVGNVIWGIILVETIVAPIYFFGFSIYEPVRSI